MDSKIVKTIEKDEEYLRQISTKVDFKDEELQNYINILEEFCNNNEVLAMAAVQLGIPKRIIYLKNTNLEIVNKIQNDLASEYEENYNESRILINPIIISRIGLTEYWESCASCLNNIGFVRRPYKIEIEYYDMNFKKRKDTFEGFESTVLSHEMDHLDGILHMDIASKILVMNKEDRKKFRKSHGYNILSKTGDYEQLLKKE